jgi:hypothetical protein
VIALRDVEIPGLAPAHAYRVWVWDERLGETGLSSSNVSISR